MFSLSHLQAIERKAPTNAIFSCFNPTNPYCISVFCPKKLPVSITRITSVPLPASFQENSKYRLHQENVDFTYILTWLNIQNLRVHWSEKIWQIVWFQRMCITRQRRIATRWSGAVLIDICARSALPGARSGCSCQRVRVSELIFVFASACMSKG